MSENLLLKFSFLYFPFCYRQTEPLTYRHTPSGVAPFGVLFTNSEAFFPILCQDVKNVLTACLFYGKCYEKSKE